MNQIVKYTCEQLNGAEIECILINTDPWFKFLKVAKLLGFETKESRSKLLSRHVHDEDKITFGQMVSNGLVDKNFNLTTYDSDVNFVNESGLYALIFKSSKPEAKIFKHWVTSQVLPSIRKTGSYSTQPTITSKLIHKQIQLLNETDLHYKVINLIKTQFPELILIPGLGELQDTTIKRTDAYNKGYVGGQPDIMILNQSTKYNGFAIELKTPKGNGSTKENQIDFLNTLSNINYKTLISCDYDEITIELTRYYDDLRFPCPHCSKVFKSKKTQLGHIKSFHSHL